MRSDEQTSAEPRRPRVARRRLWLVAALALVALGWMIRRHGAPRALANSIVAAPLVHAFNAVRYRSYFTLDPECLRELSAAGVPFQLVADGHPKDECPLRNVVRVLPGGLLERPLYMTCRLALALSRFERQVLAPAADRHLGQPVVRLKELGVRNCRPVEGYRTLLSEHAFANALDVEGFVLRDGTVITVAGAGAETPGRDAFLRDVTVGACAVFRTVLGPSFDAEHGKHLHLDMGLLGGCRP